MLPKGLICPLLIPFKANGQIDAVGLRQLWEYVNPFVAGISVGSSFSIKKPYLSSFWDYGKVINHFTLISLLLMKHLCLS